MASVVYPRNAGLIQPFKSISVIHYITTINDKKISKYLEKSADKIQHTFVTD